LYIFVSFSGALRFLKEWIGGYELLEVQLDQRDYRRKNMKEEEDIKHTDADANVVTGKVFFLFTFKKKICVSIKTHCFPTVQ